MQEPRVLSIGQCGADHGRISDQLSRHFRATVGPVDDGDEAMVLLKRDRFALVLVNRVMDRDGSSGLDVLRLLKAEPALADVPVMLVSNYPDAQAEAVQLGAVPGFGKAGMTRPEFFACMRPHLGEPSSRAAPAR